jgi:glyoxylase-like metal-dependent hydrolase (beta-lactamase superfamily II)
VRQILPYLYQIPVRLPGNPLKNLNSYVIKTKDRSLIIDTGFNQSACLEDLSRGIQELELDMKRADIFLTHFHSDHSGLVPYIVTPSSRVYIGARDLAYFNLPKDRDTALWDQIEALFVRKGFPPAEYKTAVSDNPAKALRSPKPFECTALDDGDRVRVGDIELTCILTPGHTPGHLCLYRAEDKLMILGDQVLFDITPNISMRLPPADPLGDYLDSLEKIKNYDVRLALPAHRNSGASLALRAGELQAHHKKRLEEVLNIAAAEPGLSGYETASRMAWSIRAKNWEEFPPHQKFFAVSEAGAHLDYLVLRKKLSVETHRGIERYVIPATGT